MYAEGDTCEFEEAEKRRTLNLPAGTGGRAETGTAASVLPGCPAGSESFHLTSPVDPLAWKQAPAKWEITLRFDREGDLVNRRPPWAVSRTANRQNNTKVQTPKKLSPPRAGPNIRAIFVFAIPLSERPYLIGSRWLYGHRARRENRQALIRMPVDLFPAMNIFPSSLCCRLSNPRHAAEQIEGNITFPPRGAPSRSAKRHQINMEVSRRSPA